MAYKIKINNKIFTASEAVFGVIKLPLTDDADVLYFYEWVQEDTLPKSEYVRNFKYTKITEQGQLINCSPELDDNEDFVILNYDYKDNN